MPSLSTAINRADVRHAVASQPSDRTTETAVVSFLREYLPGATKATAVAAVRAAARDGEIEYYRNPHVNEPLVTFTPLGAELAGVVLTEDSRYWVSRRGAILYSQPTAYERDENDLNWWFPVDPVLNPLDRVIALEAAQHEFPVHYPFVLGLHDPRPLPKVPYPPDGCPMHPGRRTTRREYCLYCESPDDTAPPPPDHARIPT